MFLHSTDAALTDFVTLTFLLLLNLMPLQLLTCGHVHCIQYSDMWPATAENQLLMGLFWHTEPLHVNSNTTKTQRWHGPTRFYEKEAIHQFSKG